MGAVETLIVWESLDVNRYTLMNTVTGATETKVRRGEERRGEERRGEERREEKEVEDEKFFLKREKKFTFFPLVPQKTPPQKKTSTRS